MDRAGAVFFTELAIKRAKIEAMPRGADGVSSAEGCDCPASLRGICPPLISTGGPRR